MSVYLFCHDYEPAVLGGVFAGGERNKLISMLIKPLFHIAVAVKIIVALCRVAAEQESVFLHIHTEAVLCAIVTFKGTFGIRLCKCRHIITVMQKPLILTQIIDYIIKLRLKFIGFPLLPRISPRSIKAIYAKAFSLGRITERWRLLSTMTIIASSCVSSLTSHFSVSSPASSQAFFRL